MIPTSVIKARKEIDLKYKIEHREPIPEKIVPNSIVDHIKIECGDRFAETCQLFTDFCSNSTVHGVKYFGEKNRNWIERFFWVVAFVISAFGCSIMIIKIYDKWQQTPVIVSFADKSTPVWQIPFAAVTICPEMKALKADVDFTKGRRLVVNNQKENMTKDELQRLEALAQICGIEVFKTDINSGLSASKIVPTLESLAAPMNETVLFCAVGNSVLPCGEFFKEIITEEGICYTFNMLNASEIFNNETLAKDFKSLNHNESSTWNLKNGYSVNNSSSYPRRVLGTGSAAGMKIVLKLPDDNFDYVCRGPVQGFKVLLHSPGDIPRISKKYIRVPLRQEVVVSVKPNMITTSEGLVDYSPEKRQCYFEHEGNLKFFKVYTQSNCEIECLANFTLSECNCVKFSMPRDNTTRVCSQANMACYGKAELSLMSNELYQSLDTEPQRKDRTICNCLPSCTSMDYDLEISQADFEFTELMEAYGEDMSEFNNTSMARLVIFFKDSQFTSSKRSELYGLTDFMASCGGLLGLFMGVSILSLVEILYYITLRPACNLKKKKCSKKPKKCRKVFTEDHVADY